MDNVLPEYAGGKSPTQGCTCTNGNGDAHQGCDMGNRATADGLSDGQACLWWSQGCSIGCARCMTDVDPTWTASGAPPQAGKIGFSTRYCNDTFNSKGAPVPMINATLPKSAWTLNIDAVENSPEDAYRFNPWRAPGYAPIVDPCGQAGGKLPGQVIGGDSVFTANKFATMGDKGSNLPETPADKKTKWVAGSTVKVAWGPLYNHGGGYQYRLCSIKEALTEECFQKTPLEFDRSAQTLVWNTKEVPGANAKTPPVPANGTLRWAVPNPVFVDQGTWPQGSTWARDPLPRINDDNAGLQDASACTGPKGTDGSHCPGPMCGCLQFAAPCPWDEGQLNCTGTGCHGNGMGSCSSDWVVGLIEDAVKIPAELPVGDYVLSWRWDAEETAQIWANCADVTVTA
eukprot:TRINITY_DN7659_c0_g1_i2.p1 TRINITY_DN7659_c0_g1~~TRINITY_DN7659_c0_g1_i2.p1  ORF type:complete len:400 (+),score=40.23 TRINITY_DN7659_c0_g1_i2:145-1344(+)